MIHSVSGQGPPGAPRPTQCRNGRLTATCIDYVPALEMLLRSEATQCPKCETGPVDADLIKVVAWDVATNPLCVDDDPLTDEEQRLARITRARRRRVRKLRQLD